MVAWGTACAPTVVRRGWDPSQGYEELLALSCRELDGLTDLMAEARLTVRAGQFEQRTTALLQLRMPDMLKLEVRGPFYSHLLTAVLLADTLYLHGPAVGGSWRGAADGYLLEWMTGLDLGGYDLRYALLGVVQPGVVAAGEAVQPDDDRRGLAVVPLQALPGQTRRIWVEVDRGLVVREEVSSLESDWSLSRRFGMYRQVGPVVLPRNVTIRQGDGEIQLEYRRYWFDRGLEPELFIEAAMHAQARRLD